MGNILVELCRSHALSEKGLRKIIVGLHGFAPNSDPIIDYTFFHLACRNENVTKRILRCLLEYFPNAKRHACERGQLPLHSICENKNVTLNMVQLLIDAFPDSLHRQDNEGCMPLHILCVNRNLNKEIGLDILKLLIEKCPEAVKHATTKVSLPIHYAAAYQSTEFYRILIEAYPGSERKTNHHGLLPFHVACNYGTVATANDLYQLYPESINVANNYGEHPIHYAIRGLRYRSNPKDGIEVVKFLLDRNLDALSSTGQTPLHIACLSKDITLNMVQLLIDAFPDSLRREDNNGMIPLHYLCHHNNLDEAIGLEILKLLVGRCPESVRHVTRNGNLPLHIAARRQSPEFCRILIEAYPGSERISNVAGVLPFHMACQSNTVATAKYFHTLYPESINVAVNNGRYPIHFAIVGLNKREDNPEAAIEMVQSLLYCDPNVALQKRRDKLPLYWVCREATKNTTKLDAYLKIVQILYDAYPEAMSNEVKSSIGSFCQEVQTFINTQLSYARQARDHHLMHSPDENGQLPLHRALYDNETITLGSIKLVVKGNPSAICTFDNRGTIPLHVACQHHESPVVVEYLISLNEVTLTTVDGEGNTALHYACRGANHAIIALLLDKYDSISVSTRNAHRQLPTDLLLQSKNEASDKESVEYTESMYRLIRAYPEALMRYDLGQTGSEDCQNRKKRKIDEV